MRIITVTLTGAALALSACGADGEGEAAGKPATKENLQEAALKFARCMREQGIDFPDPKSDEDGGIQIGGPNVGDRDARKMERAHKACEKHLESIEPPKLSGEEKAKIKEQSLEHARCMRAEGLDFPDPQFSEDGGARVKIGPGTGLDPRSPRFQRAQEKCAKELDGIGGSGKVTREVGP